MSKRSICLHSCRVRLQWSIPTNNEHSGTPGGKKNKLCFRCLGTYLFLTFISCELVSFHSVWPKSKPVHTHIVASQALLKQRSWATCCGNQLIAEPVRFFLIQVYVQFVHSAVFSFNAERVIIHTARKKEKILWKSISHLNNISFTLKQLVW